VAETNAAENGIVTTDSIGERVCELQRRETRLHQVGTAWSQDLDTKCPDFEERHGSYVYAEMDFYGTPWLVKFFRSTIAQTPTDNATEVLVRRRYVILQVNDTSPMQTHIDVNFTPTGLDLSSFEVAQQLTGYTDEQLIELITTGLEAAGTDS
jgi:hypothetical protein